MAHTAKNGADNIGANRAVLAAFDLEISAAAGKLEVARAAFASVEAEFLRVVPAVASFVQEFAADEGTSSRLRTVETV